MLKYIDKNNGSLHNKRKQVSMRKVGLLMKQMLLSLVFAALISSVSMAEYASKEMFVLPWGWDSDQELPYAVENDGAAFGPYKKSVDLDGNIYLAFPYRDFRKYDSTGTIVYRKEINIARFAVDNSQNVYFTVLDPDQLHILKILDKNGSKSSKSYPFVKDHESQIIDCITIRNNNIVLINYPSSMSKVTKNGLVPAEFQRDNPVDSKGTYYFTETAVGMSQKQKDEAVSYNKKFIHLYKLYFEGSNFVKRDTIPLDICRYPHKVADLISIDRNDNFYFWIKYSSDLPIDFVILDSTFKEIDRIELVPISESKGLWLRPYVLPDGTIYEFRDLENGLHVIRWSREE